MKTSQFQPGQRVRLIARPLVTGTYTRDFFPLPSGNVNVEVIWDDPSYATMVTLSTQVESIA